ncbi:hypothetical protein [Nonlabens sp.]|uniref:hypothetical protein n=1 Tax=Nonlabens sp. TaxID=1888209 RepID=UPI003F6A4B0F
MKNYKSNNEFNVETQFISIDKNGSIIKSDLKIIPAQEGTLLQDTHPFFESAISLFKSKSEHIQLDCVNMFDLVLDIEVITHADNSGVIILKD